MSGIHNNKSTRLTREQVAKATWIRETQDFQTIARANQGVDSYETLSAHYDKIQAAKSVH